MEKELTRKELENRLIERVWEDESFKKDLLNNPKSVIERELRSIYSKEYILPENIRFTIHEETENDIHLVIPARADEMGDGELRDKDLELVAGGNQAGIYDPKESE